MQRLKKTCINQFSQEIIEELRKHRNTQHRLELSCTQHLPIRGQWFFLSCFCTSSLGCVNVSMLSVPLLVVLYKWWAPSGGFLPLLAATIICHAGSGAAFISRLFPTIENDNPEEALNNGDVISTGKCLIGRQEGDGGAERNFST